MAIKLTSPRYEAQGVLTPVPGSASARQIVTQVPVKGHGTSLYRAMDSNPLIEVPIFQSTEAVSKPVPVPDERSEAFFAGARDRWLMLQHCAFCDTWSFPMRERCPSCFNPALKWRAASGRGTLYTFTIFHQSMDSGFAAHVPYNIAVALDEGVRMTSNFVGIDNAEGADRRVEVMNERPAVLRLLRASS